MSAHTTGPWRVEGYQIVPASAMEKPGGFHNHERIASVRQQGNRTKANARLIAAAPDLLEALKALLDDWDTAFDLDYCEGDPDAMRIKDAALAAIAKAEVQA